LQVRVLPPLWDFGPLGVGGIPLAKRDRRALRPHILAEPATIISTDTRKREKAIECARIWIANAGIDFDREEEVREELFERRSLRHFADDLAREEEMLDMWRAKRGAAAPLSA
jgi:hypothetical protein